MTKNIAKIFLHGRSQAVRLPKEFRLPGKQVRVSRDGDRIILEPVETVFDVRAWRASLDRVVESHGPFLSDVELPDPITTPEEFGWDEAAASPRSRRKP